MEEAKICRWQDIAPEHKCEKAPYEYYKRKLVSRAEARQCTIAVYEIPPGKAAYPYHYHGLNEEAFYIISGRGLLQTPATTKELRAGDFAFFPAHEQGAHKLTNTDSEEMLVYLDFDTSNPIDVAFYPDSQKVGIWGDGLGQVYKQRDQCGYYEGE